MSTICAHCEGWGCTHCRLERAAAGGGEQGPTADELRVNELRDEVHRLRRENTGLRLERDEAQRAAAYAQDAHDKVLAQLALLSKGGLA